MRRVLATDAGREMLENVFIQVINLDGSADRLASAQAQLQAQGLAFQRLPAFDGRGKPPRDLPRYRPWRALLWFGRPLTGGEVGCFLSHRNAAEAFLRTGLPYGLVFEDDILLSADFTMALAAVLAHLASGRFPGWRLVNLGRQVGLPDDALPLAEVRTPEARRQLCACLDFPLSARALLWSRAGAGRFVERARLATGTVDNWLRSDLAVHGGGYCLAPPLVGAMPLESTINSEAGAERIQQTGRKAGWWWLRSKWRGEWRSACGHLRGYLGRQ